MSSRQENIAFCYQHLGWSFLPLAGKSPVHADWPMRPRESLEEALAWGRSGNVGVRCGPASGGLVVIDEDTGKGGDVSTLDLPPTVSVVTGSGGRHYYFHCDWKLGNRTGQLPAGIDIRGDGGQVAFTGSIHPDTGREYAWLDGHEPWSLALAELPQRVIDLILARPAKPLKPRQSRPLSAGKYARKALELEIHAVETSPEGTRNETLNKAAFSLGQLIAGGYLSREEVEAALEDAADRAGLDAHEIQPTIRSGLESGMRQPRAIPEPAPQPQRKAHAKAPASSAPSAPPLEAEVPLVRPNIVVDTHEHRVVLETISALRSDPGIYQRGGMLVRIYRDQQPNDGIIRAAGSPTIQALPAANLRERMTRTATFSKLDRRGEEVAAHPPAWLVSAIDARGEWPGIRPLLGVSDAPVLRADGSVWQQSGYDPRTGVLFEPLAEQVFPSIPPDPTIDDAMAALRELLEVVCDFKFEAPEHRSAWLAGLLTPLARFAFAGPSPVFLIDANVRGAGKGLLAQSIGRIVLGREMPVSSYAHDPEEMRKKITSIAIAADRMVLFDNVEGVFGNEALDRASTSTWWKDRLLGRNQEVDLPLMPSWYATGNNVQVAADTSRRIIHMRLDVLSERPEERTNFCHPNLVGWINEHRPRLLSSALTILSAYCRADRPKHDLIPFGSFEGWSDLVREAVVWVGLPDPCLTRAKLAEQSDTTADALTQLVTAWRKYDPMGTGIVVSEMLARLYPQERQYAPNGEAEISMRAALENMVGCPPGRVPTPKQVGNKFRHFRRRVVGGVFIDIDRTYQRSAIWRLYDGN